MTLAVYYLAALGIVYAVTESYIMRLVRLLVGIYLPFSARVLVYCPACMGFWVGAACAGWMPLELELLPRMLISACSTMTLGALWARWGPGDVTDIEWPIIEDAREERSSRSSQRNQEP